MAGLKRVIDNIKKANKQTKKQKHTAKVKKAKNVTGNVERRKEAKLAAKLNRDAISKSCVRAVLHEFSGDTTVIKPTENENEQA